MADSQDAFVIMPFEEEFENLYAEKIHPILESKGYNVNKADSIDSQRAIIEDIVNGITNADLIIADLTGTNPNVFYELGIAHGLGVPTVLIVQDIDELPFDLSAYKTIEYSLIFSEIGEFEDELSEIAENHSNGDIKFGSPVSDYGDVEIAHDRSHQTEEGEFSGISQSGEEEPSANEAQPEKGVLEYASEVDDRISDLETIFTEISNKSESIEKEIISHAQEIQDLSRTEGRASHKRANKVAREIADSLSTYSDFINSKIEPINEELNFVMNGIQSFIDFSDVSQKPHRQALRELHQDLNQFIRESEIATSEISHFQEEISNLRGLNRELDQSIKDLNTCLSNLESILQEGVAKSERFRSLIENDLDGRD